ncbi:MAG TPA: pitrilysin family protein [Candidatus Sulfotelmatobacter sp.]|nr:pitrilysin family protein [Candidatus Sulfotelmatobacter sp.]
MTNGTRQRGRWPGIAAGSVLALSAMVGAEAPAWAGAVAERVVLPNGVRLLVAERRSLPVVAVEVLVDAGARYEPADKAGLASLTAGLLTRGAGSRTATQIDEAVDFVGASLESGASSENASVSLRVLRKDLDLGLDLLADVLLRPTFPPEELERRRTEILGGIQKKKDEPGVVAGEAFAEIVFGPHPYARPVVGTEQTVPGITRADVQAFHARWFHPEGTIVAVAGDVSLAEMQAALERRLGGWAPGPAGSPPPRPAPPPLQASVLKTVQRSLTQANIVLGHLGISRNDPDYYAVQVMNFILGGGGFGSRIIEVVREERGWAYDISSNFFGALDPGSFAVSLQTKNETAMPAIQAVLDEMRRMRDHPVTAQELDDAKAFLTGNFPFRMDTLGKMVRLLSGIELYGLGLDYPDRYPAIIAAVTIADVQRVAQQYLHPDRFALVVVGDLPKANVKLN